MDAVMAQSRTDAALLAAAARGDLAEVERLLGQGAKVDIRDRDGRTPLLLATRANRVAVARALIAAGADVNAKDAIQDSPFLYAGAEGRTEILKMTLDGRIVGKFGRAGKLLKEFGTVNSIDCRSANELYVGELGNWRVQRVTLKAAAAGTR